MFSRKGTGIILLIVALIATQSAIAGTMDTQDKFKRSNEFAFNFFGRICRDEPGHNVFVSPFSMRTVLAMTYNGAAGETRDQMRTALGFEDYVDSEINNYFRETSDALKGADPKIELNIANSVWLLTEAPFKKSFLELVETVYDATVDRTNSPEPINKWVADKTNDKIKSIIEKISPDDLMLLINAVYFKGEWENKFDPNMSSIRAFQCPDEKTIKTTFMKQSREFSYFENDRMQSVALDYTGGGMRMHIFLPSRDIADYGSFLDDFDADNWADLMKQYTKKEGFLYLPKFKLEYEKTLNDILMAMGMKAAFDGGSADFSNMFDNAKPGDAFIGEAKQKTFIEVNEEGTEAAAVSSVLMMKCAFNPDKFTMDVNRPFVCAIVDSATGEILFIGSITNPEG